MGAVRIAAVVLALATSLLAAPLAAARAQQAPPVPAAPIPTDLVGNHVAPADQSDQIFNRHGLRVIYQLLYRRPLLIVSWRADDAASLDRAVPAALALKERYGDDLVLLCVERSGRSLADMLRVVCARRWLCADALWTCELPAGLEVMPSPSFVLTSMWQIGVLTGDLVADRPALEEACAKVVGERRLGTDDLPDEAHAAWKAFAEGHWTAALKIGRAADKRRARGLPGDAEAAEVLAKQARILDDALMNELQIATEMMHSGAAAEALRRAELDWKEVEDLPDDDPLRRTTESMLDNLHHETLFAEIDASEALAKLQDKLCRNGPGAPLAASFRKLVKEHPGTKAAERALVYAAMIGGG
jgi:hypothetical protein